MKRKEKIIIALHIFIISLALFVMLGSLFYLLLNLGSVALIFVRGHENG